MEPIEVLISYLIWFFTIFLAIRLAIVPLIKQQQKPIRQHDSALIKLRDIDIFDNDELEEVIDLYQKKIQKKEETEHYIKLANILDELKEMGYFTEEEARIRMDKLKEYFKID